MRTRAALALTATALLAAPATLGAPRARTDAAPAPRNAAPPPAATASARGAGIASRDVRLAAGHSRTVLRLARVGRWTATCGAADTVGVRFTADRLLATSDLVVALAAGAPVSRRVDPGDTVTPEPPAAVLAQRWQIAPFAAAQVRVVAATVAARRAGDRECSASVVAVIGPDQGATVTG